MICTPRFSATFWTNKTIWQSISILVILGILYLQKRINKRLWKALIVVAVILGFCQSVYPIENWFYSFPSPQAAYQYMYDGEKKIESVIEGKKSGFILDNKSGYAILPKTKKGWKCASGIFIRDIAWYPDGKISANLFRFANTDDYYIRISLIYYSDSIQLTDRDDSTFIRRKQIVEDSIFSYYYAYVPNVDEDYYFKINNQIV